MIVDFLELIYGILIYLIWDRRFLLAVQIVTTGKAYLIICSDCMVHIFNCFFSLVKTGSFVHSTYFQLLVVKRDWRHHFFSPVEILVNDCLRGCQASERFVILLVSDVSVRRAERCLIENVRHVSGNLISLIRTCTSFCLHLFDRMKSYAVGLGVIWR